MVQTWSLETFSDAQIGDHVEPIGPGVYEVRHAMTARVASAMPATSPMRSPTWLTAASARLCCWREPLVSRLADLEYHLRGGQPRQARPRPADSGPATDAWRRRMVWAGRPTAIGLIVPKFNMRPAFARRLVLRRQSIACTDLIGRPLMPFAITPDKVRLHYERSVWHASFVRAIRRHHRS